MKYKSIIATTNKDLQNDQLTEEALEKMKPEGVSIYSNHNYATKPIGKCLKANNVRDEGLECIYEFYEDIGPIPAGTYYMTIGGIVKNSEILDGIRLIKDVEIQSLGLTYYPIDTSLTTVEIIADSSDRGEHIGIVDDDTGSHTGLVN